METLRAFFIRSEPMERHGIFKAFIDHELIEFETHEGQDFIVAPCVAIVPGILNRLLVPMQAISKTLVLWNGRPLVLNHPRDAEGGFISANDPHVIEQYSVGRIWYANNDDDRLKVQAWVNLAKAEELGGDATLMVERLRNKEAIEVSTGFWSDTHEQKGELNGNEYDEVADLILPDHLAMIPNGIGACNWGDGCGMPRTNESNQINVLKAIKDGIEGLDHDKEGRKAEDAAEPKPELSVNATVTDHWMMLNHLIMMEMQANNVSMWGWHIIDIEMMADSMWVIIMMDDMLMRRQFMMNDDETLTLMGEWEPVMRRTTFIAAEESQYCSCNNPDPESGGMAAMGEEVQDTLSEFLDENGLSSHDLTAAIALRASVRDAHIETIVLHVELDRAQLAGMSDEGLQKLALGFDAKSKDDPEPIVDHADHKMNDFSGRGTPVTQEDKDAPPPRPKILKGPLKGQDNKASIA